CLSRCHGPAAVSIVTGNEIDYFAGDGEQNALTVTLTGATYTYSDPGATIAASGGCALVGGDPHTASCPAANVTSLYVDTEDLNDTATTVATTPATMRGGS